MASASLISAPTAALQRSPCLRGEIRLSPVKFALHGLAGWLLTVIDSYLTQLLTLCLLCSHPNPQVGSKAVHSRSQVRSLILEIHHERMQRAGS